MYARRASRLGTTPPPGWSGWRAGPNLIEADEVRAWPDHHDAQIAPERIATVTVSVTLPENATPGPAAVELIGGSGLECTAYTGTLTRPKANENDVLASHDHILRKHPEAPHTPGHHVGLDDLVPGLLRPDSNPQFVAMVKPAAKPGPRRSMCARRGANS
ncbi:hypothetical protein ACIBSV_42950 [Embleya sp. NPDC050154]|uniref:hypothetical protein n=1 Tax=Embleya sp. NPDC050154 TaxID=3363988 RepID=UPI003795F074